MKPFLPWLCAALTAAGQDGFQFARQDGRFQLDLRPSIETVLWVSDDPPPALLQTDDPFFLDPRFQLESDASLDDQWFIHSTLRADRGFDPGADEDGSIRLDEILLRWRPLGDDSLNFQIGRFPTVFGAWQAGHDFFDDPFLIAPLPYSQIVGVQTRNPAAMTPAAIRARAEGTSPPVTSLDKDNWASIIWGPSYATGAAVFGTSGPLDYAAEIKNTALSSHPDSWTGNGFGDPTFTGRFGYRPDAAWALGVSASRGPWLEDHVSGFDRGKLQQTTLGMDARWAHHDLMVSGEFILSQFETPDAGDLRTASWFLGARWKVSPGVWIASRVGWIVAGNADDPSGGEIPWQPDVWRAELAAGWRVTPALLVKAGYAFTHTSADGDAGENLLGTGFGWSF